MTTEYVIDNIAKRIAGDIVWNDNPGISMRKWRETFGVSQSEVARILGVSQSVVADYERNRRQPGSIAVKRFVEALIEADSRRGYKIINELGKIFSLTFPFIVDMADFVMPVTLEDVILAVDGIPIMADLTNIQVYGYVVTDSIKAITALSGMEFYQFLSVVFNRILVFTKVSSGRSPMIALKIAPIRPKLVVLHRPAKIDPLAVVIANKENINVVVSTKTSEDELLKGLKNLVLRSDSK
ncbi:helix-turn-helix domain-containing protein [Metallosphaera tengchongensis]|uniref:Helix-turn-helix domain-containing protein n=1 Tax=Metallosphaera tengchongensis TaxID=1532350 RepID=A0A6N0NVU9_9CREN|nr:helix-turn-helix domain-containing protein [Metallosphaera tengchongensis]QKQ99260.1 helix-turn-helix domain-containing protein [Metallosphaera tengchongensis]